ncbi:MAG TPA: cyclic nucleotide-binding domain-containing protein, partial [Polyangiaceae bacterium]|nr:cyclic nucleotide-binding domain-containing protein [Polyangiaceae bacterium]
MTELAGTPLLSGLDARARADLRAAARQRKLAPGGVAFAAGDPADTLWFVETGTMLVETPRGPLSIGPGEHFGSEALLRGAVRASRAWSPGQSALLEISVPALERILVRAGAAGALVRESALARRRALVALLADTPLGSALGVRALGELVAEAHEATLARGTTLFEAKQAASAVFVVVSGLVELAQAGSEKSFAARGDLLGAEAVLAGTTYDATATALGELTSLRLSANQVAELARRHAPALEHAQASAAVRRERQRRVHDEASARATRHAFHELERLESARSLLAIDLERCARCGQCVSACAETHGTPRLERHGEKVTLTLAEPDAPARALLLPRACQHCKVPDCLTACPTGAITRSAGAAVRLELELCTGCGACAKACPWDAVRMQPRVGNAPGKSPLVAAKCDLCAGREGPECVSACPTDAILRLDPARDLVEARALFGGKSAPARARPRRRLRALLLLAALVPPLLAVSRSAAVAFSRERAFATGALAGVLSLVLLAHGVVKRARPVRAWLRRRASQRRGRGLGPFVTAHALLGVMTLALVLAHGGTGPAHGAAGALRLVFWLLAASGASGAL